MADVLKHQFISALADGADPQQVQPSNWNAGHRFTGGAAGDVLTRDPTDATFGAKWAPAGNAKLWAGFAQGRLTLAAATPIPSADVIGATSIYYTPYAGCNLGLYDGSAAWTPIPFVETALALGTLTVGRPYDVFAYNNAGVLALEVLAWASAIARATALAVQDGILVKSGAPTRRYLGTFYPTSTTTTEDSVARRLVWNYYNRAARGLFRSDATSTWSGLSGGWRQAHGDAANQVECVIGVAEDLIEMWCACGYTVDTDAAYVSSGVGEDSTIAPDPACLLVVGGQAGSMNRLFASQGQLKKVPAAGRHVYAWLELFAGSGAATFYGAAGSAIKSGLHGTIRG